MTILSQSQQAQRLAFHGRQQVQLEEYTVRAPAAREVQIRFEVSLMSTGTENIVFNRNFAPDTHWDRWVKYPFYPGYSAVGVVEAVGSEVTEFRTGDRVAARSPHQSRGVLREDQCVPVPDGVAGEEAVWFALAKIAYHGALAAGHFLGDRVLVIGAGPIGQMAVRWARAAGAQYIVAADLVAGRLELAKAGGATAILDRPLQEIRESVGERCGGRGPRVVIDSTGQAAVLAEALRVAEDFGTVVILGDTGSPAQQALTSDVITRGLKIVGAHDGHANATWNLQSIAGLFFSLVAEGRFSVGQLNTHRFRPEEGGEAYNTANRLRGETMGILFDWR